MRSTLSKIRRGCAWLTLCSLALAVDAAAAAAADHRGQVTFSGLPVPGATVTATRGEAVRSTVTDEQGTYRFADLADGPWTLDVTMLGFTPARRDVEIAGDAPLPAFE